jgi:hypothetical protein
MSVVTQKFQILIKQIKNAINIYIFNKNIKKKKQKLNGLLCFVTTNYDY